MHIFAIILIAFFSIGIIATVSQVGKPRPPITGGVAAVTSIIHLALIVALILLVF